MSERENILGRIREALAPRGGGILPGHVSRPAKNHDGGNGAPKEFQKVLPLVGATFEQRLELFRKTATDLKADFRAVKDLAEAGALLRQLRDVERWKKVAFHSGELTEAVCPSLSLPVCRTDQAYDVRDLESCDAGISQCDALVAQTGSVLLTSRSAGGRALSVLPPHHVVLARASQLLADLPEAFAYLKKQYAPKFPSFVSFVTGPSRTGDIERILVLGAHGPKKLTIILLPAA